MPAGSRIPIQSSNMYYPYGSLQPGRHSQTAVTSRYGFQGQEKDNGIRGEGNSLNYKYRMHDARIGRFFATDPLEPQYPNYSPYAFSGNKVVNSIELEGLEEFVIIRWYDSDNVYVGELILEVPSDQRIQDEGILIMNKNSDVDPYPEKGFGGYYYVKGLIFNFDENNKPQSFKGGQIVELSQNQFENDRIDKLRAGKEDVIKSTPFPWVINYVEADNVDRVDGDVLIEGFKRILELNPEAVIYIKGHASKEPETTEEYNVGLSRRRAERIKSELITGGIQENRIITIGLGSSQPLESNRTDSGRKANRRSEAFSGIKRNPAYD